MFNCYAVTESRADGTSLPDTAEVVTLPAGFEGSNFTADGLTFSAQLMQVVNCGNAPCIDVLFGALTIKPVVAGGAFYLDSILASGPNTTETVLMLGTEANGAVQSLDTPLTNGNVTNVADIPQMPFTSVTIAGDNLERGAVPGASANIGSIVVSSGPVTAVPELPSGVLSGAGLLGLAARVRRRNLGQPSYS